MNRIKVIGIGDGGRSSLPLECLRWIEQSEVLAGGERQLAFFPEYEGEKRVLKGPVSEWLAKLREDGRHTVVLASGDPLFYGIGGLLARELGAEIVPGISSVQLAFARVGESWQDAYVTSIHGRSMKGLAQRIDGRQKVALLTDEKNNPVTIAKYLLEYGMTEYWMFVGENLGGENERTAWYELEELAAPAEGGELAFSPLNVVVLLRKPGFSGAVRNDTSIGIPDEAFMQRKPDKGLITKREVRVLSLSKLALREDSIVWDVGACTGSVSIEAAKLARYGSVYAVEKNHDDLKNCWANMRKFRTDFTLVHAKAPEGLDLFPAPDAVFIGGSGGELRDIVHLACSKLRPQGRIVVNAATVETLYDTLKAFEEEDFAVETTMLQISRSKPILDMTRFEALNPIYVITAWREKDADKAPEGGSEA